MRASHVSDAPPYAHSFLSSPNMAPALRKNRARRTPPRVDLGGAIPQSRRLPPRRGRVAGLAPYTSPKAAMQCVYLGQWYFEGHPVSSNDTAEGTIGMRRNNQGKQRQGRTKTYLVNRIAVSKMYLIRSTSYKTMKVGSLSRVSLSAFCMSHPNTRSYFLFDEKRCCRVCDIVQCILLW